MEADSPTVAVPIRRGRGFARGTVARALALLVVVWIVPLASARAAVDVFPIEGVISDASYGVLFGDKMAGQTFLGSFAIDREAMLESIGGGGQTTSWSGEFAVTIEGVSYPATLFRVWSSGPTGAPDGFEFSLLVGGASGFLSLRSSQDLYDQPLLPTEVEIADMDILAEIRLNPNLPTFATDTGAITFVPEAGPATLGGGTAAALAVLRLRAKHRSRRAVGA